MKRFKNILLFAGAENGGKAALARTMTLAKRNQAHLTVAGVFEALPREVQIRMQRNNKIMELAASLAEAEGSELHIVHTWTQFAKNILRLSWAR
jgi:hypothetical protein